MSNITSQTAFALGVRNSSRTSVWKWLNVSGMSWYPRVDVTTTLRWVFFLLVDLWIRINFHFNYYRLSSCCSVPLSVGELLCGFQQETALLGKMSSVQARTHIHTPWLGYSSRSSDARLSLFFFFLFTTYIGKSDCVSTFTALSTLRHIKSCCVFTGCAFLQGITFLHKVCT